MLNDKFKEIIKNLDDNIENQNDLNYAKSQVAELSVLFLDEFEKLETSFQQRLKSCEQRIDSIEKSVIKIEDELYQDDIEADLEPIKCPYCDTNLFIEFDNTKKEIQCPICNNMIELDWGNFEDDM